MSIATSLPKGDLQTMTLRSRRRTSHLLCWSLRVFGAVDLLATAAAVAPAEWLISVHTMCGLGAFPEGPLPLYLARSTSMLYAFHGAILWYLSTDITRFRPAIRFIGRMTVVFGVALVLIDLSAGIPVWWLCLEGPVFALTGIWLIVLTSRLHHGEGMAGYDSADSQ